MLRHRMKNLNHLIDHISIFKIILNRYLETMEKKQLTLQ